MLDPFVTGDPSKRFVSGALQGLRAPADPQTYRNFLYLLLGLPLGTIWFTLIVTVVAVGVSLIAVALIGVPVLLGSWYLVHSFAAFERWTTIRLLGQPVAPLTPIDHGHGNLWARLRHVSNDAARWRELRYLMLRFLIGIATFVIAVALPTVAATIVWTPFYLRRDDHDWGTWPVSTTIENLGTNSPWSWFFLPTGLLFALASLCVINRLAGACGRWTARSISGVDQIDASRPSTTNSMPKENSSPYGYPGCVGFGREFGDSDIDSPEAIAVALSRVQNTAVFAGYAVVSLALGIAMLKRRDVD